MCSITLPLTRRQEIERYGRHPRLPRPITLHPLLPDAIIDSVHLTHPKERVLIKGRVVELRPWPPDKPRNVYGTLRGEQVSIDFKCPVNRSPRLEGEYTVLSGYLSVKPKRFASGLEILLTGDAVSTWTPSTNSLPLILPTRTWGRQSLLVFVREHGAEALLVLTTKIGQDDFRTALTQQGASTRICPTVQTRFGDRQKLLADLDQTITQHPAAKALAFVRGGGDADGLALWDDPELVCALLERGRPFYTALGHSDRLLLADKHSDDTFATPTAFGQALGQALEAVAQERRLFAEFEASQQETARLTRETERLTHVQRALTARHRQRLLWVWGLVGVLAAVLAAMLVWGAGHRPWS